MIAEVAKTHRGRESADALARNQVLAVLRRAGLLELGILPELQPLTGGVSSDIWRVDLEQGAYCVKRALPRLRVAADWQAPVERSAFEAAWMQRAADIVPDSVLPVIYADQANHALVMPFLDPEHYRNWKTLLLNGSADRWVAETVADRLGRIHKATAGDRAASLAFASDKIFHDIRLEPYLLATAIEHRDVARPLRQLAEQTARTKKALVHGDVSPKNILVGTCNIVFLDAECAWYGDPAFDLAFCLNHLLLKAAFAKEQAAGHLDHFAAMVDAYKNHVTWEPFAEFERRVAALLPGLSLGRIDGRSPVEYITSERVKNAIRMAARKLLLDPASTLPQLAAYWRREVAS